VHIGVVFPQLEIGADPGGIRAYAQAAEELGFTHLLTGGRFRLGVGIGWNYVEYEGLGKDFKNRTRRFEEQIALIRELTMKPIVNFAGRYEPIRSAGLNPLPVQRPLPIWIGGFAEPALKRAAEITDGFFPLGEPECGWPATLDKMKAWRTAADQSWSTFGIEANLNVATDTAVDWRKKADELHTLGATHLSVNTTGGHPGGPDGDIRRLGEAWEALRGN
jgi:alkanesulfonate monooxygenase SsuD/methylene tetrahydromethanopterin reductase-like flavin-dependent oxidoreductase (luciferase family)